MSTSIVRLLLGETGTYNDMTRRPYHTQLNGQLLARIQDSTQYGKRINAESVAGVAGQILMPMTEATGVANIANGWGQTRYHFMMEVHHDDYQGGRTTQYVAGYTDHVGASRSGYLDPNMRFYINTVVSTRQVMVRRGHGGFTAQQALNRAEHVLFNPYQNHSFTNYNTSPHLMRPEDVFGTMGAAGIMGDGLTTAFDARMGFLDSAVKKSNRRNSNSTNYLSTILKTHQNTMMKADLSSNDEISDLMDRAAGSVHESTVDEDLFLGSLRRQTGFMEGQSVTYAELTAMAPHLDSVTTVVQAGRHEAYNRAQRGAAEHWGGTTHETIISTILSHSVPSLMMDLMITKAAFTVTNRTLNGQPYLLMADVKSFMGSEVDLSPYLQSFQHRFLAEIFTDLTHNGQIDLEIQVAFDVIGDTTLDISVQGQSSIRYVTPSFADALFTPIWGENADHLRKLSSDIDAICTNLEVSHHVPHAAAIQSFGGYAPTSPSITHGSHEDV